MKEKDGTTFGEDFQNFACYVMRDAAFFGLEFLQTEVDRIG